MINEGPGTRKFGYFAYRAGLPEHVEYVDDEKRSNLSINTKGKIRSYHFFIQMMQ